MRYINVKSWFLLLLLALTVGRKTEAQESYSLDWNLSQLRGTWEVHTFYEQWTLVFECDHQMLIDREPADYTLMPGSIRIRNNGGVSDYPYNLDGNKLTLTLPDGSERTYRKTDPGDAEQTLHGKYYLSVNSSLADQNISFDGDHLFKLYGFSPAGTADKGGIYRVENDAIVLTFDDSTVDNAQISFRDADGSVGSIMCHGQLFETEQPATLGPVTQASPPIIIDYVPPYSPPPDPYSPPLPPVGPAPTQAPPPAAATAPSSNADKSNNKPRTFGSTRGPGGK